MDVSSVRNLRFAAKPQVPTDIWVSQSWLHQFQPAVPDDNVNEKGIVDEAYINITEYIITEDELFDKLC